MKDFLTDAEMEAYSNAPDFISDADLPSFEGGVPPQTSPQPRFKAGGAVGAVQDVAQGAVKQGTKSILGLGRIGQKIQGVVGKGLDAITGDRYGFEAQANRGVFSPSTPQGQAIRQKMEPTNTAQRIGGGIEKVAEFALPGVAASKAEKVVTSATQGLPKLAGAGARIFGKGAVQGAAAGATEFVTSGGDVDKSVKTALIAGVTRGALATLGEGARAAKIPERLYQMVFKNSKADMLSELNTNGVAAFQKADPQGYKKLVEAGVIRVGENGKTAINDTLAEKALDHGLRGSISNMANEVVRGKYKTEALVREIAKTHRGTVDLPEEQYQKVLLDIADEYDGVGFGEIQGQAQALAQKLKGSSGQISAEDALELRRFLDKLRITSSYDKPVYKLSTSQANLKTLADSVRQRLNAVPGMGEAMKEYSFYIDALEALAQEARRRGNNQVLGLIDSLFLGEGLAGSNPVLPITAGVVRRIFNSPGGATRLGSSLANPNLRGGASSLLQSGSSGLRSVLGGQE